MTSLLEAYKKTKYKIFEPSIIIEIGKLNHDVENLLKKHNSIEWAFVTAYNPYSKVLTDNENKLRHEELKELIKKYVSYEGHGVGEDPKWKPELSLLIIGISKEESISIGNKFEQNAIIFGRIDSTPQLLILNHELK